MDLSVMASVLTWVEQHPTLAGLPAVLEDVPPAGEDGVMVLSIPGDIVTRYKGGGYVASQPFAVVVRRNNPDTQKRLDTLAQLGDMAKSIDDENAWPLAPEGFDYYTMEVRTLPARATRDDTGADDYQVTFTLTYRKRG
jgi:hypothetical protein